METEVLGYVAAIFMGLSLGMIGGGGSILTVPILVYLFAIDAVTATTYSLFVVGSTALVGGLSYFQKKEVDLKTVLNFALPSFLGVYLSRGVFVPNLPAVIFTWGSFQLTKPLLIMIAFALLMVVASRSMIRAGSGTGSSAASADPVSASLVSVGIRGFLVGLVTGFVGAGGGFLIVPALVLLVGLPMKKAVGSSLVIIAMNSTIGFLGGLRTLQNPAWSLLLQISAIAILGLIAGMRLNQKVSERTLKKVFGYFVLVMGTLILIDQIRRL